MTHNIKRSRCILFGCLGVLELLLTVSSVDAALVVEVSGSGGQYNPGVATTVSVATRADDPIDQVTEVIGYDVSFVISIDGIGPGVFTDVIVEEATTDYVFEAHDPGDRFFIQDVTFSGDSRSVLVAFGDSVFDPEVMGTVDRALSTVSFTTSSDTVGDIQFDFDAAGLSEFIIDDAFASTLAFNPAILGSTLTVSAVPEPSTTAAMGMIAALVVMRRRKRTRRSQPQAKRSACDSFLER